MDFIEGKGVPPPRTTVADMLSAKGSTEVYAIGPQATVYEAIVKMTECQVGALVVLDGDRLVGIISERDYTRKVAVVGRSSKETRVEEIMSAKVITIEAQASLTRCMHTVSAYSIRHLPVMAGDKVVGVLGIGDLVRAVLAHQIETIQSLNSFIGTDYPT